MYDLKHTHGGYECYLSRFIDIKIVISMPKSSEGLNIYAWKYFVDKLKNNRIDSRKYRKLAIRTVLILGK